MAIPTFPAELPLPLRDGYGMDAVNGIRSTPMDSGRSRQRIEFTRRPSEIRLNWLLTQPEAMLFQSWAEQVAGAGWFTMTLVTPLGWDAHRIRFKATPKGGELQGRYAWRFESVCEVEWTPLLPPGWAELLPDYVLHADIFDYAMNDQWPLYFFDYPTYAAALADIRNLLPGMRVTVEVDENQAGRHSVYQVGRADSPSLVLDFLAKVYQSGNAADSLTLVVTYD